MQYRNFDNFDLLDVVRLNVIRNVG